MPMLREHPEHAEQASPGPVSFQDALRQEASTDKRLSRKLSEESIRTELCDGPVPDSPPRPRTPEQDVVTCSDRAELIERLKRGESPTWIPSRNLENLVQQTDPRSQTRSPRPRSSGSTALLPPLTITPEKPYTNETDERAEERLQDGLNIERPRSALHSGDFRHHESSQYTPAREPTLRDVTNRDRQSSQSWLATSPPRDFALEFERRQPLSYRQEAFASTPSSLASSLSQSFAYMPPTSPLVQSESNDDLVDLSLPMNNIDIATGGSKTNASSRRHTLHFYPSSPYSHSALSRHLTHSRENSHHPYQAHQPRRSLTSTPNFNIPGSAPQTPGYLGSRRPSLSSDASPMLHASMVGSYEESILRGRMSTTPSKPLDFQAEIGVLGLGKCKPSLKCPAHVTVPFSAVFYNYTSTTYGRTPSEDGPSPYVGQIDLENGLSNPEEDHRSKRKMATRYHPADKTTASLHQDDEMDMEAEVEIRNKQVTTTTTPRHGSRRSHSPKSPPGGSYRIPEKGMLQIIIKNQNKTAVKLFLLHYDLAGMEPGTKTFVRQRSYSDPNDDPLSSTSSSSASASSRPILRYLIQLHICCLAKGRHYLYKSIRVVFANRVPDGKEKLRQEVTYPEPRFSPYKPTRAMMPSLTSQSSTGPGAMLAAEQAYRRRSSGFSFGGARRDTLDGLDGIAGEASPLSVLTAGRHVSASGSGSGFGNGSGSGNGTRTGNNRTVDPIPLSLPRAKRVTSNATSSTSDETKDSRLQDSLVLLAGEEDISEEGGAAAAALPTASYGKLSKGDVGYGGNAFATAPSAAMEGLLAKSLRTLGVRRGQEES